MNFVFVMIKPVAFLGLVTFTHNIINFFFMQYMICEASKKSSQLVHFLAQNSGKKIMV
jgi:formate/nitrite transporter FocA (FNT family)